MNLEQRLQDAIICHQANRFQEAERLYRSILQIDSKHPDANHNLGLLLMQAGQPEIALSLFFTALESSPDASLFWVSTIDTLIHLGQLETASNLLKQGQSKGLKSDIVDQLAEQLQQAQIDSVIALYSNGQIQQALDACDSLITGYPNEAMLYNISGVCYAGLGQLETAVKCYEQALAIKSDYAEAHSNLGITLKELGQLEAAVKHYKHALTIKPDCAEAHNNLGISFQGLGQLEAAVKHYEQALAFKPNYAEAHINLANVLKELGQLEAAVMYSEKALAINPNFSEAHYNLGNALTELNQLEAAIKRYERALAINPEYAEAKWNLSLSQLVTGSFKAGWLNYESRWQKKDFEPERHYPQPFWDGSSLVGQTLFLYPEQGMGDAIQFIRYVKVLSTKTTQIIVECPKSLYRLFSTIPEINVLLTKEDALPDFDFYAPLLSLPGILNTTLKTIPVNIPYLLIADHIVSPIVIQSKVLNIGIVWAGSSAHQNDKNRSINLSFFSAITNIQNTQFYSLQVTDRRTDLYQDDFASQIIDVGKHLGDYAETATIINQLDLIITVDTSVAHLAGAMGKPVWVLLPFAPDWRWLLDRNDSPWYPSMRLFRQQERGNWTPVFNKVRQALEAYRMTVPNGLDLSEVLLSTTHAFKAGDITTGHAKLTELLGLLRADTVELSQDQVLTLKPFLNETLTCLKNKDYSRLANILEKDLAPLLERSIG